LAGKGQRSNPAAAKRAWQELSRMSHPFPDVSDFLTCYARRLVELSQARSGELHINNVGRIILSRAGEEISADWLSEQGEGQASGDAGEPYPGPSAVVPVVYADAAIGHLRLSWNQSEGRPDLSDVLPDCARQLAFMVKRYEVSDWARRRLGRSLLLVGMSEPVRNLEVFVEKASQSDLPSLVYGEFGTETPYLAAAIHCCGPRRDQPFIQVNCAQPHGLPEDWFRQAEGGTLFFSDIDALAPALQSQLPQYMHSRLGQWLDVSGTTKVRVIASATVDLRHLVAQRGFSRQLLAELDFLPVTVPPLRARVADIEPLVIAALEGHGYRAEDKISAEMLELCRAYSWPENAFEVERVVARLAVMTGRESIRTEDIRRYFPALYPEPESQKAEPPAAVAAVAAEDEVEPDAEDAGELTGADIWVRHALNKDAEALATLHPGLRRAVLYLVDHYPEPIRLGALARRVHVSQSHLSFLFRHGLHTSCKGMLARIRVERAKVLLAENVRQPITDVALQVGFADLSHFEKYFRRQVGRTPREFRRMAGE
jgi:transcriptional regulator with AAA-type ATPase domain/AraC-like DNA-binding protein